MRHGTDRPNVIVFFTDQQRWDTTGVHGNPLDLTPNLDRMCADGTHLANSFTCQPVCGPARSALQTGRYPTATGCFTNGVALPDDAGTLAHRFRDAGYTTGYIGKWHLGDPDDVGPVAAERRGGYEYWLASNILEFTSWPYDTVIHDGDGRPVRLPGYRVDALTDAAIRYVHDRADDGRPFFLFLSHMEPHHQNATDDYPAPEEYRGRYAGRWTPPDLAALGGSADRHLDGYLGMVKRVDEALGRLLDAVRSLGLDDDTIVLFTSDHGCHFKTRNSEYKRSCHDASIRVPTAIRGPGFDGGGRVPQLVSLIDLPPTLLDGCGIAVPEEMAGRSVRPLLGGSGEPWPEEVLVQISESQVGRAVRTHRWKYGVTAPHADPWRDAGADRYVEDCLYDLETDPHELRNLIGSDSHREVAAEMRERLGRRVETAGEPRPRIDPAPTGSREHS